MTPIDRQPTTFIDTKSAKAKDGFFLKVYYMRIAKMFCWHAAAAVL